MILKFFNLIVLIPDSYYFYPNRTMFRTLLILFFISMINCIPATAQSNSGNTDSTNIYNIYEKQVDFLLQTRGVPGPEIMEMMKIIRSNKINSDESLADLLGKLYSSSRGIGIIFIFSMAIA